MPLHNARIITLAEKEQPQEERFSFQPPIPIPLNGSSAMETSHNAHITLYEKEKPLEKRFSFQSPIPLPSEASLVMDAKDRIKSAYRFTMPPVTRIIADTKFRINSELGMVNGPKSKATWPNSCLLASQNSSDIKSCVFSTLWSELQTQRRILAKRRSELKDRDKEPLSKRFRFHPAIPLCLGGSLAMESVGEDTTEEDESPEGTKESGTDEKVMELKKSAEKPLVVPFADPFHAFTVTLPKRCDQPLLEMIEEEGSLDIPSLWRSRTDPEAPLRMVSKGGQSTSQPPERSVFLVRPRLRSELPKPARPKFTVDHTPKTYSEKICSMDPSMDVPPTHSESEQPRPSRTTRCKSSGRNDINSGQNRELRPRRHSASTEPVRDL